MPTICRQLRGGQIMEALVTAPTAVRPKGQHRRLLRRGFSVPDASLTGLGLLVRAPSFAVRVASQIRGRKGSPFSPCTPLFQLRLHSPDLRDEVGPKALWENEKM